MTIIKIIRLPNYFERRLVVGIIASMLTNVGNIFAGLGSQACICFILDEPKCPKSLIK